METEVYSKVKFSVKKLLNINLEYYKDEQMRRRLDSWLVRSGAPNWEIYFGRLREDGNELSRFRDYLTINVSAFFRDTERWHALREVIVPELLQEAFNLHPTNPGLRLWSAGCSIGAEPYSLSILLDECSPSRRHYILATDLDRGALSKAKARGPYTSDEIQNFTSAQRASFLAPGGPPHFLKPGLERKIEFREHDLVLDPYPEGFDLIICRNVVIYFTGDAKEKIYRKFYQALRPGGILFVGATEIIPRPQEIGFQTYGISFYRRGYA